MPSDKKGPSGPEFRQIAFKQAQAAEFLTAMEKDFERIFPQYKFVSPDGLFVLSICIAVYLWNLDDDPSIPEGQAPDAMLQVIAQAYSAFRKEGGTENAFH